MARVERLSAVTLAVADMARAVAFYESLGFTALYGGADADFTSFGLDDGGFVNLQLVDGGPSPQERRWGRAIFWVDDVDAMHDRAVAAGLAPSMAPSDAPWGERYFHITDPDGHELSFAKPL